MEAEIRNVCTSDSIIKSLTEAKESLSLGIRKDQQGIQTPYPGMLLHQNERWACEGDCTPFAILCFVEGQGVTFQVYVWPAQRDQFPLPGSTGQGQHHNDVQVRIAACLACSEQALAFRIREKAHPPSWLLGLAHLAHGGIVQPAPLTYRHGQGV